MGIRVHKMLGYGLTDVVTNDDGDITDARIDMASPWARYELMSEPAPGNWPGIDAPPLMDPRRLVVHQSEYGLSNVLCVRPSFSDWYRHDDPIDWVEESYGRDQQDWVKVLPHGIYPWSASYMDARTGERIPDSIMDWVRGRSAGDYPDDLMDELAQAGGFNDSADAAEHCVPTVPADVRDVVKWARIFNDQDTWRQLRPMLYCWWS